MNLTKNKYEILLLLHHKLCSSNTCNDAGIVDDLLRELNEIEKFHLFPTDPILAKVNTIYERCADKGLTLTLRLELAKEFYIYLAKMMFSFEGATLPSREQYIKLLEYNRTEFPYELANKWGERLANTTEFKDDLFFFMIMKNSLTIASEDAYLTYRKELRITPIDFSMPFKLEESLSDEIKKDVNDILLRTHKKYIDYVETNYFRIRNVFRYYCKKIVVYVQCNYRNNACLVMINVYDSLSDSLSIYPNNVEIMYRFANVEAIDQKITDSLLTGFIYPNCLNIEHIFSISGIHHDLNRIFIRYASSPNIVDYITYILRGQLKSVSITNENEIIVDKEKWLLLIDNIPSIEKMKEILFDGNTLKYNAVIFRFYAGDEIVEMLKDLKVKFYDVSSLGRAVINNQNGEMIHLFIKARIGHIQIDDSFREVPQGKMLIKRLQRCSKGRESWSEYELLGTDIFHYLFRDSFRNYTYEFQSTTYDGISRRDLVVNNTYKEAPSFWQMAKDDYKSKLIIIDFKNYSDCLSTDDFYKPTKYLSPLVGNFAIIFSRCGLSESAKICQNNLLIENKLIICLSDSDLINMINQKMNGQDPLCSLENIYFTLCKNH
jgi:hypothetical protein